MRTPLTSACRVAAIAGNTFKESVRQRFFLILALLVAMLGIAALWFRNCGLVAPRTKFLLDTGFGALAFFGAIVAIVAAAESFSGEIERRTVLAVLARPVWRAEFVLGKLAGILLLLLVYYSVGTGFLAGWSWCLQVRPEVLPGQGFAGTQNAPLAAVLECGFVQWLRCGVLAAMTLLVATYARSSLLAVAAGFTALALCSLRALICDASRVAGSGWERGLAEVGGWIVPDFKLYEIGDKVAAGGVLSGGYLVGISLYSTIYVSLFIALAVHCFGRREL